MTKVVNLRTEPYDIYIGRAGNGQNGYFGNNHPIGFCSLCNQQHNRAEAIAAFRRDFYKRIEDDPDFFNKVWEMKDKTLGCFCKRPDCIVECHGDIYAEYLDKETKLRTYKGLITKLESNQIFVFGSNLDGFSGGGAAGYASFGVVGNRWREFHYDEKPDGWKGKWNVKGIAEGYQMGTEGASYAIPTVTRAGSKRSLRPEEIEASIRDFYDFAKENPEIDFLVAQENKMGYSGYTPEEMAAMYSCATIPMNVIFEEGFNKLIIRN